ncbi:MAG: hypothetical protein U5K28_04470 [Halobacteriales archaeon]|nr:hypothetical protein [Halobacteriales archaeon]
MTRTGCSESVRAVLQDEIRSRDILGARRRPRVLSAVFVLPATTRESLAFAYREPTVVTAYTAHFVHFKIDHLAANVLGYVLLAGSGYVLAVLAGQRRLFGASAVTYVLAFPFALSGLNLAVPRNAVGYGFSGVNIAFAGVLGLLLVAYASRRIDSRLRVRHAPGVFFTAVVVVSLLALPAGVVSISVASASALVAGVYVVSSWYDLSRTGAHTEEAAGADSTASFRDIGMLAAVVFFGYPFVGFPPAMPVDGSVVNLYVHLLGFCLGFIVPYVALEAGLFDVGRFGEPLDAADAAE